MLVLGWEKGSGTLDHSVLSILPQPSTFTDPAPSLNTFSILLKLWCGKSFLDLLSPCTLIYLASWDRPGLALPEDRVPSGRLS